MVDSSMIDSLLTRRSCWCFVRSLARVMGSVEEQMSEAVRGVLEDSGLVKEYVEASRANTLVREQLCDLMESAIQAFRPFYLLGSDKKFSDPQYVEDYCLEYEGPRLYIRIAMGSGLACIVPVIQFQGKSCYSIHQPGPKRIFVQGIQSYFPHMPGIKFLRYYRYMSQYCGPFKAAVRLCYEHDLGGMKLYALLLKVADDTDLTYAEKSRAISRYFNHSLHPASRTRLGWLLNGPYPEVGCPVWFLWLCHTLYQSGVSCGDACCVAV